jgi:hypothetical protein
MRSAIGSMELDKTFEQRGEINEKVVKAVAEAARLWGAQVTRYEIKDIKMPTSLQESMERQMKAERDKRAAILQSEGEQGIYPAEQGICSVLQGIARQCAGAVEQPQRRLLGVSGLAIEDFKLKASTNAQLTSQPKPSLMALQKMPIGQLWGGGRLVDLFKSSLSRLWMA